MGIAEGLGVAPTQHGTLNGFLYWSSGLCVIPCLGGSLSVVLRRGHLQIEGLGMTSHIYEGLHGKQDRGHKQRYSCTFERRPTDQQEPSGAANTTFASHAHSSNYGRCRCWLYWRRIFLTVLTPPCAPCTLAEKMPPTVWRSFSCWVEA